MIEIMITHNTGVLNFFQRRDPLIDGETELGPQIKKKIKEIEKVLRFKMSQLCLIYFKLSHHHICKK